MKSTVTILIFLLLTLTGFSQLPGVEWQNCLGGSGFDQGSSMQQTADGGYIVAGRSNSNDGDVTGNHGSSDYWVVKLSMTGTLEWQKSLGGSASDRANSIQQTADGGYIVAGVSESNDGDVTGNHGGSDYWVVKLFSTGEIEWQKALGGSESDFATSIKQTSDGGYIVAGNSQSNDGDLTTNNGEADYWVVKLLATGEIDWQKSFGGSDIDYATSIEETSDGGYIVAGISRSNDGDVTGNHGDSDFWVVKLTDTGELEWQKSLGGSRLDQAWFIRQTLDGGYIVAGNSSSNDGDVTSNYGWSDYWIVKLFSTGEIDWQKSFGGSRTDYPHSIKQTTDGGYIIAGTTKSDDGDVTVNHGSFDYWIVKLTTAGIMEWQKSFGGLGSDSAHAIQQTSIGYIVAGYSGSNNWDVSGNHGSYDYWVVKLSPNVSVNDNELGSSLFLYPNPNKGRFSLSFSEAIEVTSIRVVDVLGKLIYSESNILSGTMEIDRNFSSGVYFVNVSTNSSEAILKMIVE